MPDIESTTHTKRRAFGVHSNLAESAAVTVFGAAVAFAVSPTDPIALSGGFPWIAFVPMFIGLMHGFVPALGSLVILGLWTFAIVYFGASSVVTSLDPRLVLGILLVGLVPAEVRDRLVRENERLRGRLASADRRCQALSRSHSLLLASHRNLERATISDERSLFANFERLRDQLRRYPGPTSVVHRGAQDILSLFAGHGLVQSAVIFRCDRGKVDRCAIASIGGATVDAEHPLVDAAITGRCVATVRELDPLASGIRDASVLAVVPLVDARRRVWGVVVVLEMPFIALRDDHLRVLLSIGSALADVFSEASESDALHDDSGDPPSQIRKIAFGMSRPGEAQEARDDSAG